MAALSRRNGTKAGRKPSGRSTKPGTEARGPGGSAAGAAKPDAPGRRGKAPARGGDQAARRAAILAAGLAVFAEHGFEAARLDDVAARAGVAKGTLYLYFRDKPALFEEIVRDAAAPLIARFEALSALPDVPVLPLIEALFGILATQVLGTDRKLVVRLVVAEGPRFPSIAKFYYDEVVSRGIEIIRTLLERGVARGEIKAAGLVEFPQLVIAPMLMAVLWDGLFQKHHPLDFAALAKTHLALLSGAPPSTTFPGASP